jgi:hypothetical protein
MLRRQAILWASDNGLSDFVQYCFPIAVGPLCSIRVSLQAQAAS